MNDQQKIAHFLIDTFDLMKDITYANFSISAETDRIIIRVIPMYSSYKMTKEVRFIKTNIISECFPSYTFIRDRKDPRLECLYIQIGKIDARTPNV